MLEWVSKINFTELWSGMFKIIFQIIKMPFETFNNLPTWVKFVIFGVMLFIAITVIIAAYRRREDYLNVQF